ncbi:TetR/AcrR family transcriptional regulator [Terrabacter lapilli]
MDRSSAPPAAEPTAPGAGVPRPGGKRAQNRRAIEADILRVAREHLAHQGAAALSLRAIARDLGMVSSGIYRYVDSRDELLTRLIVDSFSSLAAAVGTAHDAVPRHELEARWDAVGRALRTWALERPHDFALIYGSPVPDYEAPPERTVESGTAVLALLVRLLADIRAAGRLADAGHLGVDPDAAAAGAGPLLQDAMFDETGLDAATLAQGVAAWTLLLGGVTSEVFAQLGPLPDGAALFECLLGVSRRCIIAPPA